LERPEQIRRLPYGRKPKRLPVVLDRQEVLQLFAWVRPRRTRMVLTTMYATGMRVAEAVHLGVADIDSRRMTIVVARGKGNKQRLVPLTAKLLDELRRWWQEHRDPMWLFPGSRPGCPLAAASVQRGFQAAWTRAGLTKRAKPHSLRHTFATELLEADVDLLTIQKIPGHKSLQTTARYTHVRRRHLGVAGQVLDLLPLKELLGERPQARRKPTVGRRSRK
jgi:site-specific recombinase XerD